MKKLFTTAIVLLTSYAMAQEELKKNFKLSGSIDAYFRQNLSAKNGANAIAPTTSFANLNGFALGMANVIGHFETEKVGAVADLVFGPRGEDATFLSPFLRPGGSSHIINQLYVFWNVSEKVSLTFGNFNTFLGYEVISPASNFNYSTSYLFSYGPFSHTGLKADFSLSNNWSAMLAVMNNTDQTEFNLSNNYTLGGQLGYNGSFINFIYGKQGNNDDTTFQIDLTSGYNISNDFYLGLNASYQTTGKAAFYGAAIYPQFKASPSFLLGARAEYFAEKSGGVNAITQYNTSGNANVFAFTLTGSYEIASLTIKPELRIDTASETTFFDTQLNPSKSLASTLVAAIYQF